MLSLVWGERGALTTQHPAPHGDDSEHVSARRLETSPAHLTASQKHPRGRRSAFLGSCFTYLAATHPATRFLTPAQASGALVSLFVGQALAAELTGLPMDWTEPLLRAVLRLA